MATDNNDSEKYLLVAKADNVKHISSILKAVNFKDVCFLYKNIIIYIFSYTISSKTKYWNNKFSLQVGVCFATEHGLKIVVEDSKCVQANTFIGSEIFQVRNYYFVLYYILNII